LPSGGHGIGFHRSASWLAANGFDSDREGVIEIYNAFEFLEGAKNGAGILIPSLSQALLRRADQELYAQFETAWKTSDHVEFPSIEQYVSALSWQVVGGASLEDQAGCKAIADLWKLTCH
jgi:hypothetical protein